jgi:prophage regulatory protein
MEKRIIRMPELEETVGLSAATIYRRIKAGEFPAQIKLGKHASGWILSEVHDWIQKQTVEVLAKAAQQQRHSPLIHGAASAATITEIIKAQLGTETLRSDEVAKISGHKSERDQAKWLTENRWVFHVNGKGEIIIGRMYARLRLCGVELA